MPSFLFGSPAYDPALCAAALEFLEPGGSNRLVDLNSQSTHNTMDNNTSFPERIKLLKAIAEQLRDLANDRRRRDVRDISEELHEASEVVMTEVLHMETAQRRFAARKNDPRQTTRASRYPHSPLARKPCFYRVT